MHYRPLGATGASVSEISLGCNRLGEPAMPDEHWTGLVLAAIDRGVNLFDTSESYGWGRSEEVLGRAVGNRDDVYVATKVSRVQETGERDFSATRVIRQAEGSLRRLQRDRIDFYQLHSPSLDALQSFDWPDAFAKLKADGKIRWVGVSVNDAASAHWLTERGLADALQVPYNILEPEIGEDLFSLAEDKRVGILIRTPMAQGILTGKFRPGQEVAEGHRARLAGERMEPRIEAAERYRNLAEASGLTFGQYALRYALSPAAVSAAIPGARTIEQLEQNVTASNGFGLTGDELARVEETRQDVR